MKKRYALLLFLLGSSLPALLAGSNDLASIAAATELTSPRDQGPAGIPAAAPERANPILPGYFADPSLLQVGDAAYIYATLDPWGDRTLGCWESGDFKNWTYRTLNWPTKEACTSATSGGAAVWAPSVVQAPSGKFYMAVSVGSEVWMGVANHPLGPWQNVLNDRPLVPGNFKPGYHMIDAELFVDDDGKIYLYWGSGLNWVNGRCFVGRMNADLTGFDGEPVDVTPSNYFEAPFVSKRHGKYFLMYSAGNTTKDTYQVRYAVGDSPFGPFIEGDNSPILQTDHARLVISPGHHAVFQRGGRDYILYHRHSIPFDPSFVGRQVCVDELQFRESSIDAVIPPHDGPDIVHPRWESEAVAIRPKEISASGSRSEHTVPRHAFDNNYATRWTAPDEPDADGRWLQVDLGGAKRITRQLIRPEYAWKRCHFAVLASADGTTWRTVADFREHGVQGSPVVIDQSADARYLRLVFPSAQGLAPSIIEWAIF